MKFKTIVVTKNKILIVAAIAAASAAGAVIPGAMRSGGTSAEEAVEAFAVSARYEKIFNETLPSSEEGEGVIERLTGIDADNPETIIAEYSPLLESGERDADYAPENGFEDGKRGGGPDREQAPSLPELPDHDAICASVGLTMNNATNYDVDINALCAGELSVSSDGENPAVLIVHTHTTECYSGDEMSGETERNTDENVNVIAVGNEIANVLEGYGIKTLHDTTYHDYPSYQGSYGRALTTIDRILKENPTIQVVLDIHRDAFVYSDGSRLRVACEQNGVQTAQVMLVVGTNSMGLWHDNWRDNLTFAAKIQNSAEIMYPGLMRPVNLRTERFNGHMTRGSLILEVGSNGNSLEEAKEGGRDVARAVAAAILNG